jgi:hypothetical protein
MNSDYADTMANILHNIPTNGKKIELCQIAASEINFIFIRLHNDIKKKDSKLTVMQKLHPNILPSMEHSEYSFRKTGSMKIFHYSIIREYKNEPYKTQRRV